MHNKLETHEIQNEIDRDEKRKISYSKLKITFSKEEREETSLTGRLLPTQTQAVRSCH